MKLHVGCGKRYLDGWTNVDANPQIKADLHAPAHLMPSISTKSVDVLMAIHLFEHLYLWEVPPALEEWHRVLKSGGRLILEMPDIMKAAKNLLDGQDDQQSMWPIYGDPGQQNPFNSHRWGWHPKSITKVLAQHGFVGIREEPTQFHSAGRKHRDMRIVAERA